MAGRDISEIAADLECDAGPPPADYETCLATMKDAAARLRQLEEDADLANALHRLCAALVWRYVKANHRGDPVHDSPVAMTQNETEAYEAARALLGNSHGRLAARRPAPRGEEENRG